MVTPPSFALLATLPRAQARAATRPLLMANRPAANGAGDVMLRTVVRSAASDSAGAQLLREYQGISWNSYPDRKQALLDAMGVLGGTAVAQALAQEFTNTSWGSYGDRRMAIGRALAATGDDLALTTFLADYQNQSWGSYPDRKRFLLNAIRDTRLAAHARD